MPGNLTVCFGGGGDKDGEWNTSRLESRCVCKESMENRAGVCAGIEDKTLKTFVFIPIFFLEPGSKENIIFNMLVFI